MAANITANINMRMERSSGLVQPLAWRHQFVHQLRPIGLDDESHLIGNLDGFSRLQIPIDALKIVRVKINGIMCFDWQTHCRLSEQTHCRLSEQDNAPMKIGLKGAHAFVLIAMSGTGQLS